MDQSTSWDSFSWQEIESNVLNHVIFDAKDEDQPPPTLWCLSVMVGTGEFPRAKQNSVFGLLLVEHSKSSSPNMVFRRVGVFTVSYPDGKYFELCPLSTVTLI